jgi:hypothetical protein
MAPEVNNFELHKLIRVYCLERAQSADNRSHVPQQQQVHENGVAIKAKKELRRSHDRLGELLSALRPSKSSSNNNKHGFQNIGAILS